MVTKTLSSQWRKSMTSTNRHSWTSHHTQTLVEALRVYCGHQNTGVAVSTWMNK